MSLSKSTCYAFSDVTGDGISTAWPNTQDPYYLYASKQFEPIPERGDCLGLVTQLAEHARGANSGVMSIIVTRTVIWVMFEDSVPTTQRITLLNSAIKAAAGSGERVIAV